MAEKKSILKSSAAVIAVMLCSRVLGFLRQAVIAGAFGASGGTDIYFVSSEFVLNVAGALTGALTTALVTVYIAIREKEGREAAGELASKVLTLFLLTASGMLLLLNVFATQVGSLLAPPYEAAELRELAKYLRFFSVGFLFAAFQSIYAAVLNANDVFVPGKLYGLIFNPLAMLAILLLGTRLGILSLVYAYYAANLIQMLLLYLQARKVFRFRPSAAVRDSRLRQVFFLALPILVSNLVIQLNEVIDKAICAYLGVGVASDYTYAHTLEQFVTGTFTISITLILLSKFADLAAREDRAGLESLLKKSVTAMVLILCPVALITVLCSRDIVTLVYMRGQFGEEEVRTTALALAGFAAGFPLVALREIFIRVHFAVQKTRWPMVISTVSVALNVLLSVILARWIGILGVTAATSTAARNMSRKR